jgi:O-6-methylguanine DNA methyltransferase
MRCRDVDALWDEMRGDHDASSLKETVHTHLGACPSCQAVYEQYEGVAFCLSCLPQPEPSCNLAKRVIEHIATLKIKSRTPISLAVVATPIGRLFVGFRENRIAYIGIDVDEPVENVRFRIETRLHRPVVMGDPPTWLQGTLERFFATWVLDEGTVDISDLTPFEQAALRAAAQIPPGEVRSSAWVATQMGRPKAARAVGQAMARNPIPLFFPCHRVVDSTGALHNYFYGLEMKARILALEGYRG